MSSKDLGIKLFARNFNTVVQTLMITLQEDGDGGVPGTQLDLEQALGKKEEKKKKKKNLDFMVFQNPLLGTWTIYKR